MSNSSTEEKSRTQNYDYTINWSLQRLWREVAVLMLGLLIPAAVLFYRSDIASFSGIAELLILILGLMLAIFGGSVALVYTQAVVIRLRDIYFQSRYRSTARKYPTDVQDRIINAYNNVQPYLLNPGKAKWKPRLFSKMFRQYAEFERIGTDELKRRLESAGVFDVNANWYQKGKTIEDALMLAVYSARLEVEEAKRQATEKSLEAVEARRQTTPDIHSRKNQELNKEALEQELEKYVGARTQSEPRDLIGLGGQYVIHSNNGEKAKIAFTLPAGDYIAELYDFRGQRQESEDFRIEQDGGLYILKLNGRGFSEHTEITLINKGTGAREEIQLW